MVPAFNIPYLPMMEPVVAALRATRVFGLIAVARLEWIKFEARSLQAVYDEYQRVKDERFTRLHLDHVPVIDEDNLRVDDRSGDRGGHRAGVWVGDGGWVAAVAGRQHRGRPGGLPEMADAAEFPWRVSWAR